MEHNQSQFAAMAAPAQSPNSVTYLRCLDVVNLDPEPIYEIFAMKGEVYAEAMICKILEDIAHKLDSLQIAHRAHLFEDILGPARRISSIASQLGLTDVWWGADNVAIAAQQKDGVALSATLARLERAFDAAVSEVWRYRERS